MGAAASIDHLLWRFDWVEAKLLFVPGFCSLVRGGRRIPGGRLRGCGVSMVIFHDVGFCAFVKWIWSDCW